VDRVEELEFVFLKSNQIAPLIGPK
jgi:hypothetical protein